MLWGHTEERDHLMRKIAKSLHHYASKVPATLLSDTDVQQRIVQHCRHTATMVTAAVTLARQWHLWHL